jgi:glycosyl transferase family 25
MSLMYYKKEENEWFFLDKVVYINLKERNDRKIQIISELGKRISKDKIIRFDAIKNKLGHIGCSMSHIRVIEMAIKNNWENVLVVEDDAMFYNYDTGYKTLKKLILKNPNFDVITLGSVGAEFDNKSGKLYRGQTCTAYLVNKHYYYKLLTNFKEGLSKLLITQNISSPEERYMIESKFCIDQYWKL